MAQQRELCFSGHELRDVRAEREVFRVCKAEGRGTLARYCLPVGSEGLISCETRRMRLFLRSVEPV